MSEQTNEKTSTSTSNKSQWKERECGAAWGTSEQGRISFHILNKAGQKVNYIMFPNKFKEASNQPDWRVYIDAKDYLPATAPNKTVSKPSSKQTKAPEPQEENQQEFV